MTKPLVVSVTSTKLRDTAVTAVLRDEDRSEGEIFVAVEAVIGIAFEDTQPGGCVEIAA
jgi:hypothetical protein